MRVGFPAPCIRAIILALPHTHLSRRINEKFFHGEMFRHLVNIDSSNAFYPICTPPKRVTHVGEVSHQPKTSH
jgi:hypothetical protein